MQTLNKAFSHTIISYSHIYRCHNETLVPQPLNVAICFNSLIAGIRQFALNFRQHPSRWGLPRESVFLLSLVLEKEFSVRSHSFSTSADETCRRVVTTYIPFGGAMQSTSSSGGQTIRVLVADDTRIHTQLL